MPRHKLPYILRQRKDTGYYQLKLASWKSYKTLKTKRLDEAQDETLRVLEKEKQATRIRKQFVLLEDFVQGFFDQDSPWVKKRNQGDHAFSSAMSKMRTGHLNNYVAPAFGSMYLHEIDSLDIEDWYYDLANLKTGDPLSGQTKNHILYTFSIILREAKRQKLISQNPVLDVEKAANKYKKRDAFSLEEIRMLFPAEREKLEEVWSSFYWAAMAYLALTAGLRSQEVRALLWKHIVWDLSGLTLLQAVKADGPIGSLKSGEQRGVLLPARTISMLEQWRSETPFPEEDHLIFYGESADKPINRKTISKHFKRVLIERHFDVENRTLVFHSLRHTYNTRMRNVLTEAMLHYMIGHKSQAMTQRYDQAKPEERLLEFLPESDKLNEIWN